MNTVEFKDHFNTFFDSVSSNLAPDLDDYEISVFLTKAQEEIVKNKFEKFSNKLQKGAEESTKRRAELKNLIKHYTTSLEQTLDNKHIVDGSQFFILPSDIFLPLQESVQIVNTDCNNEIQTVKVKPITYDEYNIQKNNPFKKPDATIVWRFDYNNQDAGNNLAELISSYNILNYSIRYIKYPNPIIISDLTLLPGGLSINGLTSARTSELDQSVHREILDRAVELAILSLRENNLSNTLQVNSRNE